MLVVNVTLIQARSKYYPTGVGVVVAVAANRRTQMAGLDDNNNSVIRRETPCFLTLSGSNFVGNNKERREYLTC